MTWYLDGWVFEDGATAQGSFTYDADSGQVGISRMPRGMAAREAPLSQGRSRP